MGKATVLLATIVLTLLISLFASVCTVKAQGISVDDLEFKSTGQAIVGQPFEIVVTVSGGTPPYTFQWYTQWFPPLTGISLAQQWALRGNEIAVPGANSPTFWFTPPVEGYYWIAVSIWDSAGQSLQHYPNILPFQLYASKPQPTPTLSPSLTSILPPPIVSLFSPKNQTYSSNNATLVFSVNEEYSWLGFSFDSLANVTIAGNTTLTDLPDGNHSVVVYVNNTFGLMGKSEIVHFTVKTQKPLQTETEPFLLPLVIASIISVAVIGVGLLVYFKKRKN